MPPRAELSPGQLVRVLETLRQAEHLVERLSHEVLQRRSVVRLPEGGYPLAWIEREAVTQALEMAGWVQREAARLLGVTGRVMHYKIRRHGIRLPPDVRVRRWRHKDV